VIGSRAIAIPRQVKNSKVGSTAKLADHVADKTLIKVHILRVAPLDNSARQSKVKCIRRRDPKEYNGRSSKRT
jgi:hypothetical protein